MQQAEVSFQEAVYSKGDKCEEKSGISNRQAMVIGIRTSTHCMPCSGDCSLPRLLRQGAPEALVPGHVVWCTIDLEGACLERARSYMSSSCVQILHRRSDLPAHQTRRHT